jgi:hypothetical protein
MGGANRSTNDVSHFAGAFMAQCAPAPTSSVQILGMPALGDGSAARCHYGSYQLFASPSHSVVDVV